MVVEGAGEGEEVVGPGAGPRRVPRPEHGDEEGRRGGAVEVVEDRAGRVGDGPGEPEAEGSPDQVVAPERAAGPRGRVLRLGDEGGVGEPEGDEGLTCARARPLLQPL